MDYKDIAIYKLLSCNYKLYIPLNSNSNDIVIYYRDSLKLCLVKTTRDTKGGPNILFGGINYEIYDCLLAVDKITKRCWIIPLVDIDFSKKSLLLSAFAHDYAVVPQKSLIQKVLEKKRDIEIQEKSESLKKLQDLSDSKELTVKISNLLTSNEKK